jgi:DNA transformation protein
MPTDNEVLDHVTGLLTSVGGISSKAMFGGYGIFHEGAMFGIVKGTGLFFKVNDSNRVDYEKAGSSQYKPMPYYQVPVDVINNTAALLEWARASINAAHETVTKKKQR